MLKNSSTSILFFIRKLLVWRSNDGDSLSKSIGTLENTYKKGNWRMKLSNSKVGKRLASISNAKFARGFSKGVAQVANPLGKFFLAKTVINGIVQGDTTSLAILGARVGSELGINLLSKAGVKMFSSVGKLGKMSKFLGKVAGPLGAVADIGLSAWSLSKSVDRLKLSRNKYERDDAIADIVQESVDIAVTAIVTTVSIAFPPAAPLLAAAGIVLDLLTKFAVSIFKGVNEVNRINSEIPLLNHEKRDVFISRFFDWFGTRKPDYIDGLLEQKRANDLAVQHNLRFLEQNDAFRGIVFPSRTFHIDGSCRLTHRYCRLKNIWGCTSWDHDRYTLARGCDWGRSCGRHVCKNFSSNYRWGYNDYICFCDGSENAHFGDEKVKQKVDFTKMQKVYWERAVPKYVENARFICKPGNLAYIDYKVSQSSTRNTYLCENAIGILQPHSRLKEGQAMLFDLKDGEDEAYAAEDSTLNIFRMGDNGYKNFYGGRGKDTFLFDSNCRMLQGNINGGSGTDTVILGDNCIRDKHIQVDFENGFFYNDRHEEFSFRSTSVEEVYGREAQPETVVASCKTQRVEMKGGTSRKKDLIQIPSVNACPYRLAIIGAINTCITSQALKGEVTIHLERQWKGVSISLEELPSDQLKLNVIVRTTSSEISSFSKSQNKLQVNLTLTSLTGSLELCFNVTSRRNDMVYYFIESPAQVPYSVLYVTGSPDTNPVFHHSLPRVVGGVSYKRRGNQVMENFFDITGTNWEVVGGGKDDEFVLHTRYVTSLDGGGGVDTLKLHGDIGNGLSIKMSSSQFRNIENIQGTTGVPVTLNCACDTKLVSLQGGSDGVPDVIVLAYACARRKLHIMAMDHSHVIIGNEPDENHNDVIQILASTNPSGVMRFHLELRSRNFTGVMTGISTNHKHWMVAVSKREGETLHITLAGIGEWIELEMKTGYSSGPYLKLPYIQLSEKNVKEPPGILVVEGDSLKPKLMYELDDTSEGRNVSGYHGIENMFRFGDDNDWFITGGELDDIFSFNVSGSSSSSSNFINLDGGDGDDVIFIDSEATTSPSYIVNLAKGELGPQGRRGTIKNIENIQGRHFAPDVIHLACTTKSVNGKGGRGKGAGMDVIIMDQVDCLPTLHTNIALGEYTLVRNGALQGHYTYIVETDNFQTVSFELTAKPSNLHQIKILSHLWNVVKDAAFNIESESLAWKLVNNDDEVEDMVQAFQMSRSSDTMEEYDNPMFVFNPLGSEVTSDIRVNHNGTVFATYMIRSTRENVWGIPVGVNSFLVNVTEETGGVNAASVYGCSDGSRCSANQFWIFKLESTLELLDGGDCEATGGCENYLHMSPGFHESEDVIVDLSTISGSMTTTGGKVLIRDLRNIHEFHGTHGVTAYVSCNTSVVNQVDKVYIMPGLCHLELVIGLREDTQVYFEEDNYVSSLDVDERLPFRENSTVNYRFIKPMSFDLQGSYAEQLLHTHRYWLPLELDELEGLLFNQEEDTLHYYVNGKFFHFSMLASAAFNEEFYSQPDIVTKDGFRLQVARDGTFCATLGEEKEIVPEDITALQKTANKLQLTMLLQTPTSFFYIGYNVKDGTRSVVQNVANVISYLSGGGGVVTSREHHTLFTGDLNHLFLPPYNCGYAEARESCTFQEQRRRHCSRWRRQKDPDG